MIECINNNGEKIWYESDLLSHAQAQLAFDIDYWKNNDKITGSAQGRGTTWFIEYEDRKDIALRHYYRGGFFGKILTDQFLFRSWVNSRSVQEMKILDALVKSAVNVPTPLGARTVRHGCYYTCDIITARISDAQDLVSVLVNDSIEPDVYLKIGREIKKMHRAGVNHADLNIHNILLDAYSKVWLIDFDKCRLTSSSSSDASNRWQQSNLDRLKRSFLKEFGKHNIHWQESKDWQSLLAGYHSG